MTSSFKQILIMEALGPHSNPKLRARISQTLDALSYITFRVQGHRNKYIFVR